VDTAISDALAAVSSIRCEARLRVLASRARRQERAGRRRVDPPYDREAWRAGGSLGRRVEGRRRRGRAATVPIAGGRRSFMTRTTAADGGGHHNVRVTVKAPEAVRRWTWPTSKCPTSCRPWARPCCSVAPFDAAIRPTADRRFRRNETLRVQTALAPGAGVLKMTLLDRNGRPMSLSVATREVDGRAHWAVGDLTLAPLAASEYVIRRGWRVKIVTALPS
jgi:hypothetical protein